MGSLEASVVCCLFVLPAQGRLVRFVDEDNALSMAAFADSYSLHLLSVAAQSVILRNFDMVRLSTEPKTHSAALFLSIHSFMAPRTVLFSLVSIYS